MHTEITAGDTMHGNKQLSMICLKLVPDLKPESPALSF